MNVPVIHHDARPVLFIDVVCYCFRSLPGSEYCPTMPSPLLCEVVTMRKSARNETMSAADVEPLCSRPEPELFGSRLHLSDHGFLECWVVCLISVLHAKQRRCRASRAQSWKNRIDRPTKSRKIFSSSPSELPRLFFCNASVSNGGAQAAHR